VASGEGARAKAKVSPEEEPAGAKSVA
jgi:hypothetical protein